VTSPNSQDSQQKPKPATAPALNPAEIMTIVCSSCNSILKVKKSDAGKSCRCRCGTSTKISALKLTLEAPNPQLPEPVNKDFDFDFDGSTAIDNLEQPTQQPVVGNPYQSQRVTFSAKVSDQLLTPRDLAQRAETQSPQKSQLWEKTVVKGNFWGEGGAVVVVIVGFLVGIVVGIINAFFAEQ
jgi:hypothetical protein